MVQVPRTCWGMTCGQSFAAEIRTYSTIEDGRTNGTKGIKCNRQLRASQTRYTRGGTEGLREQNEEGRE